MPSAQHVSLEQEKQRYDLHRNHPDDPGHRSFLNHLFTPLHERLAPHSHGLDFGSGPEPTLARMFEEAGHSMTLYDRFYAPDSSALKARYDFIAASEVVEHLRQPCEELDRIWSCLKPGGMLGIMTKLAVEKDSFPKWHYKNDLTHICFFSKTTFEWLAVQWKAELVFPDADVVLFNK